MTEILNETRKGLDYLFRSVVERGWEDSQSHVDDFSMLRSNKTTREAQIAALYEEYFLPDRHEFEWEALREIATAVTTAPAVKFTGMAIVGGVVGNAAFAMLKSLCSHAAVQYRKMGKGAKERSAGFEKIAEDAGRLKAFFAENSAARIGKLEESTGIPREKIYPLLKLSGFIHYRRQKPCLWEKPAE